MIGQLIVVYGQFSKITHDFLSDVFPHFPILKIWYDMNFLQFL